MSLGCTLKARDSAYLRAQVLGKHKAGRPRAPVRGPAGSKAAVEGLHCDMRSPVFSARCLARLLTAVVNDGLARDMGTVRHYLNSNLLLWTRIQCF